MFSDTLKWFHISDILYVDRDLQTTVPPRWRATNVYRTESKKPLTNPYPKRLWCVYVRALYELRTQCACNINCVCVCVCVYACVHHHYRAARGIRLARNSAKIRNAVDVMCAAATHKHAYMRTFTHSDDTMSTAAPAAGRMLGVTDWMGVRECVACGMLRERALWRSECVCVTAEMMHYSRDPLKICELGVP